MKVLAQNEIVQVSRCDIGVVHINLIGVTFHFHDDAFILFTSTLMEAYSQIIKMHKNKPNEDKQLNENVNSSHQNHKTNYN